LRANLRVFKHPPIKVLNKNKEAKQKQT